MRGGHARQEDDFRQRPAEDFPCARADFAGGVLIDVRTPGEVAEGTAPGSINIPLQEAEQRLAEFPKDKDLLIFCRSGKRSMAVSNFLIQNGYERVFNVVGGFLAFPKN